MGIPAAQGVGASGLPVAGDQANAVLSGIITGLGPTAPFAFRGPMNLALWASINTTLTTTAGSLTATVASATGLAAGDAINSVNVPTGTTIATLSGTNVTFGIPPITLPGVVGVSAAQISGLPSTTGLLGATVSGPGIPSGTTVTLIKVSAVAPTGGAGGGAGSPGTLGTVQISNLPTSAPSVLSPQEFFTFARNGNAITVTGADAKAIFTGGAIDFSATVQLERSFDGGATFTVCNVGTSGTLAQWISTGPINITFGEPEKNVLYRFNCTAYTSAVNYRISQTGGAAESLAIGPLSGG